VDIDTISSLAGPVGLLVGVGWTLLEQRKRFWRKTTGTLIEVKRAQAPIPVGTGDTVTNARIGVYDQRFDIVVRCSYLSGGELIESRPFRPIAWRNYTQAEADKLASRILIGSEMALFTHPTRLSVCRCTTTRLGWGPLMIVASLLFSGAFRLLL
jgi:hypothetical protein